ncbi:MAG: tyrosine-type recombinase/integrase [Devosia sp.]
MSDRLTDKTVKLLPTPASGNRIHFDSQVGGFGVRVTAGGSRSFIFSYRTIAGRQRRFTIGEFSESGQGWNTSAARGEAERLRVVVRGGGDPLANLHEQRDAPTVADLAMRFEEDHLPKRRAHTADNHRRTIRLHILPALKHRTVAELNHTDIADLHRKVTRLGTPYAANRMVAVLSKMLSESIKWGWRTDNPAKGVERNDEEARHRYLSPAELAKLTEALAAMDDQQGADIIRMLVLTGARRGEVFGARWDQFDLTEGVWTKPPSSTKQKRMHRVPLSAAVRQLLVGVQASAEAEAKKTGEPLSVYVFPATTSESGHREDIKKVWRAVCKAAGIVTTVVVEGKSVVVPSARVHDLRHTYASLLASAGMSLPIIGALLGHSQPATTARYAHLLDDPLRKATERVGALVMPGDDATDAEVVPFAARR